MKVKILGAEVKNILNLNNNQKSHLKTQKDIKKKDKKNFDVFN